MKPNRSILLFARPKNAASTQSVAILVKNRVQEGLFNSRLHGKATWLHRDLNVWKDGPDIFHGTYHSAKGLEFDMVILPFLDAENLPDKERRRINFPK